MANEQAKIKNEQAKADLNKLLGIYDSRLKILREFRGVSVRIEEELENNREEAAEAVDALTIKREAFLEKIKEADMAVRYGETLLGDGHKKILKEIKSAVKNNAQPVFEQKWARYLFKNLSEYKALVRSIQAADEKNAEAIKALMENIKIKIKAVKENKRMTDKFADDFFEPPAGILMKEKK